MSERNEEGYQTLGWIINKSEDGLFLVVADEPIQQEIVLQADAQTFFIVNFQFAVQSEQDISRLNFSRDMLMGLGKNLVFFYNSIR